MGTSETGTLWGVIGVGILAYCGYLLYQHFAVPTPPNLEQQRTCAEQSEKVFKRLGYDDQPLAVMTNRYNVDKGRCFMLISMDTLGDAGSSTTERMYDAFSGEQVGNYFEANEKDKPQQIQCAFLTRSARGKTCSSKDDWLHWSASYMQPISEVE
jgi:hypothetical protein